LSGNAQSLSDIKVVHILIALELLSKIDKNVVSDLRSDVLERFRRRQITEIDRKITKQLLDLTLLLRTGLRGQSLEKRLSKFDNIIAIESASSEDILFKVKLERLLKNFGDLNIIALSSYVVALSLCGEEHVHLLSPSDYSQVKNFFAEDTIPIPRRREVGFEITVLGVFATLFFLTLLGFTYMITYLVEVSEQLTVLKGHEVSIGALISTPIFGLVFWKIRDIFKVLKSVAKRE
jgi:hypothetical protein